LVLVEVPSGKQQYAQYSLLVLGERVAASTDTTLDTLSAAEPFGVGLAENRAAILRKGREYEKARGLYSD